MKRAILTGKNHDGEWMCNCPHCGKHNMDLGKEGKEVGEFMCIRCGEDFLTAHFDLAKIILYSKVRTRYKQS